MIKPTDPAAMLCMIAIKANVLRTEITKLTQKFNQTAPKCEWFLTGKQCCNPNHHQNNQCGLMTCPITEIKKDPKEV